MQFESRFPNQSKSDWTQRSNDARQVAVASDVNANITESLCDSMVSLIAISAKSDRYSITRPKLKGFDMTKQRVLDEMDIEATARALEEDEGFEIPDLRQGLTEAKARIAAVVHTPEQIEARQRGTAR